MGFDPDMFDPDISMSMTALDIRRFSPSLFWDVEQCEVDPVRHRKWLLERVLERGKWEDWLLLSRVLGKRELEYWAPRLRITDKSLNFLRVWMATHA
jgi:hypothetical protein